MNLNTMTIEERERLAYTEGFTQTAKLLGELIDMETDRDTLREEIEDKERLPVRYFMLDYDLEDGPEVVEVDEAAFLAADGAITYERHTVWANGVNQICLTKGLEA
jgi:hypothetical protein